MTKYAKLEKNIKIPRRTTSTKEILGVKKIKKRKLRAFDVPRILNPDFFFLNFNSNFKLPKVF